MGDINLRPSDPLNYQLPGDVSLMWLPRGKTGEKDWEDLGNLVSASLAPTLKQLEHFSIRRSQRSKDRIIVSERSAQLNFSIDEINELNLQKAFGATAADMTDSQVDKHDNKTVLNPGENGTIDLKHTDINVGSLVVRNPELAEDQTPYVVNVDYTIDEPSGIITILPAAGLADNVAVPKLNLQWSENFATRAFEIFPGREIQGMAKFVVFTPGGIKYAAVFNNVVLKNNGDINFGDGSTWQEVALQLDVLVDEDGILGLMHIIDEE